VYSPLLQSENEAVLVMGLNTAFWICGLQKHTLRWN